jgi:hypothetical protein
MWIAAHAQNGWGLVITENVDSQKIDPMSWRDWNTYAGGM